MNSSNKHEPNLQKPINAAELPYSCLENLLDAFSVLKPIRDENEGVSDFRIEYVNKAACDLSRRNRNELEGCLLGSLLPGNIQTELMDDLREVLKNGLQLNKAYPVNKGDYHQDEPLNRIFDFSISKLNESLAVSCRVTTRRIEKKAYNLSYPQYMEELVRRSTEGMLIVDENSRIIFANPAAQGLLGQHREIRIGELTGFPVVCGTTEVKIASEKRGVVTLELQAVETCWEGRPAHIVNLRDITRLKHADRDLRESEKYYSNLFETMEMGVVYQGPNGEIITSNPAAEHILGMSLEKMQSLGPGGFCDRMINEDGSAISKEGLPSLTALRTGKKVQGAMIGRLGSQDEETRWIRVNSTPQFKPGEKKPYQVYTTFVDITDRKKAFDQAQRLAAIIQSTQDAVISKTVDGIITSWNNAAERMFGYSAQEAIGRHVSMLCPDEIKTEIDHILEQIINGEKVPSYETVRRTKAGKRIYVSLSVSPIKNEAGRIIGASAIARDVTEQKLNRLELEEKNQELSRVLSLAEQREKEKTALLRASRAVLESRTSEEALRNILDVSLEVIGAVSGYAAVLGADGDGNELFFIEDGGFSCGIPLERRMPIRGLKAKAYQTGMVVWENDLTNSQWMELVPAGHLLLDNVLFAPLIINGIVKGVLGLANKRGGFNSKDARIAAAFGNLAAVAFQRFNSEALLQESEEKYRYLFNNAPIGLGITSQEGKLITHNKEILRQSGYSDEDISGVMNIKDFFYNREDGDKLFEQADGREFIEVKEVQFRKKNGTFYHASLSLSSIMIKKEKFWLAMINDISERKRAEASLRKSEHLLNATGEMARVGGWEIDFDSNKVSWTPTTQIIHETPAGYEPTVEDAIAFFDPDVRPTLMEAIRSAREQGTSFDLVLPLITARGKELWTRVLGKPDFSDGRCVRIYGALQDVTKHRAAERKLLKSEAKYRDLFEFSPVAMFKINVETGKIDDCNQAASDLTGCSKSDMIGTRVIKLYADSPNGRDKAINLYKKIKRGEVVSDEILDLKNKGGEIRHVSLFARPQLEVNGRVTESRSVLIDITGKKKLEEQFYHAQKMESIGRLAAGVAHDFNNILTTIIGNSHLIMLGLDESSELRRETSEIKEAAERAATLTRQLLLFSRKERYDLKVIKLNEIVGGMEKMLRRMIGEDVRLVIRLDSQSKSIKADPGQIEQVLMNLVVNARDAMPGGGSLIMETNAVDLTEKFSKKHPMVKPGRYIRLTVTDSGHGMDKDTLDRIFDPFFTTKGKGKGTGLGLAAVYGIIEQNKGFIWVYSEIDYGTTFKIYFPMVDNESRDEPQPKDCAKDWTGRGTVLIVEDNQAVCEVADRILTKAGFKTVTTSNAQHALDIIEDMEPTLILSDVILPGATGPAIFENLREERPDLKILYMSGYTEHAFFKDKVFSTCNFIEKPFTPQSLLTKVQQILTDPD